MKELDENRIYYVYAHYRPNDSIPFYIGKGYGNRFQYKNNRNRWWKNIVNKYGGFESKFLHKNLKECESLCLEAMYINAYGRADQGKGPLVNLTDGGEGASGVIHSSETRLKYSLISKQRTYSEETRLKMRNAALGNTKRRGTKHKTSSIKKMKTAHKNLCNDPAYIHPMKGKKHKEKSIQKMKKSAKGRTISTQTKMKMRNSKLGTTLKPHVVKQIKERMMGNKLWEGKQHTEESKQKMRDSWVKRKQQKETL